MLDPSSSAPRISVTVPTRGRPDHLRACVDSILACEGPSFELVVVDQSDDRAAEDALRPLLGDPRLRYVRSDTRGVCRARNAGIALSRGEILVCTDDDCRAAPDWLAEVERIFAGGDLDILGGQVQVPEEVWAGGGFAAAFAAEPARPTVQSFGRWYHAITANFSFRRTVVERIGGFDEMLGVGGQLGSGSEPDFLYRALLAGLRVEYRPEPKVIHLGVRLGQEARLLIRRYHYGAGAAYAKFLRLGHARAGAILLRISGILLSQAAATLVRKGRPTGLRNLISLWQGVGASFRYRVGPGLLYQRR